MHKLCEQDRRHVWHPYTSINEIENGDFPIIERGEGIYLYEIGGKRLIDGISSWWGCALGHCHPQLVAAIVTQTHTLQHSILGGMSHPTAIALAEHLARIAPSGLTRVLFAGDGASAVEAALKVSLQYWANLGESHKKRFVSLSGGYHGDTLGAMGVGYVPTFHQPFKGCISEAYQAQSPHCRHCPYGKKTEDCDLACFATMERILLENHENIAGVIVEPLCQAAAGMRIYPAAYLARLRALCNELGILLIADEIAMGFYRTGTMFACNQAGISPDILCLGKALTSGYMPMSATLVTETIYDAFRVGSGVDRSLYHGHTFCGNPITAAVALAAVRIYDDENFSKSVIEKGKMLAVGIDRLRHVPGVTHVQSFGMIGVVELKSSVVAKQVAARAYVKGLLLRPLQNIIYLMPPLISSARELEYMCSVLADAIQSG